MREGILKFKGSHLKTATFLLFTLIIVITIGTFGFMIIEGWSFFDSLFMTIITISTVGYEEVHPLSSKGRVVSILIILLGVVTLTFTISFIFQVILEGRLQELFGRRSVEKKIDNLKDHYIVCGYGKVGKNLIKYLEGKTLPIVVIEPNLDEPFLEKKGIFFIKGDAEKEETLIKAGIKKAKALITLLSTDADNLFLTLTARDLNPNIFIYARAETEESFKKFVRAGANRIISPFASAALRIFQEIKNPELSSFVDLVWQENSFEFQVKILSTAEFPQIINKTIREVEEEERKVIVIALRRQDKGFFFNPSHHQKIEEGDSIIVLGTEDILKEKFKAD